MIIEIKLTERTRENIRRLGSLGDRIAQALRTGLAEALVESQNDVMKNELSGQTAKVRTGSLRRSVSTFTWSDAGGIGGAVVMTKGPADRYAAMVHEGGTITPKKGKYLAVPLPAALTGSGVIKGKYNTTDLRTLSLACFRSKAGNLILAERTKMKTKTRVTPLFVLKTSVTIGPHPYLEGPAERLRGSLVGQLEEKINLVISA